MEDSLLGYTSPGIENSKTQGLPSPYDWLRIARANQRPPEGEWRTWMILGGRGFGKTRTGAETIRHWVQTGKAKRIALIGQTYADVVKVMVEGESGLLNIHPPEQRPIFYPTKQEIVWSNGAVAQVFSGDRPDQLRGPQFDCAWVDEIAKFRDPEELSQMLDMALRLGENPRVIYTTTPHKSAFVDMLMKQSERDPSIRISRGTTFENFCNLPKAFFQSLKRRYGETYLALQEMLGLHVSDKTKALWKWEVIEQNRYDTPPPREDLEEVVISVDPAVSQNEQSDETGIIVAARDKRGHGYVLEDASGKLSPHAWSQRVRALFAHYRATKIVVEVNQGGNLVEQVLRQRGPPLPVVTVRATKDKYARAAPVATLYEDGRIHHPPGGLESLEHQMVHMEQAKSPDRVDALVWAMTHLFLGGKPGLFWEI